MAHEVIMPALGMAQDTGLIVSWLKQPGDAVKAGDPIMEVETDKATMEVEAQADGYLTDVRAAAGDDVPVGDVVALISDSPEGLGEAAPATEVQTGATAEEATEDAAEKAPASEALPDGQSVIMPALGMAQESGLIVAWHKNPGDAVAADDVLLEVETDKATMEVPAGHDGFIAALMAEAGEDVPVGDVIAVISAEKPDAPQQRSAKTTDAPATKAETPAPKPTVSAEPAQKSAPPAKATTKTAAKPALSSADGRILASPKAKRLAAERGLDLARLVQAGHPQPYHVSDLEELSVLPATAAAGQTMRLTARAPSGALSEFFDWIAAETGTAPNRIAILAALAAAALREPTQSGPVIVAASRQGTQSLYSDPDLGPLGAQPDDAASAASLILRDLTGTPLDSLFLGTEAAPVLCIGGDGPDLSITLECVAGVLSPEAAINLISGFAGRLKQPLRHLL
jgi:pyruvate/2-oxoglutarate dehydrogenase complex dihydrolipoamide acyltransferase (E2) component